MTILVVTGTGTEVGKTVSTAALAAAAAAAGKSVAVVKPVQTGVLPGEPGDMDVVARLSGGVHTSEFARYPDPLAPNTAARRAGLAPLSPAEAVTGVRKLAQDHDLVLVEGAGGLLAHFDDDGGTLADVAAALGAAVLMVVNAGLGTLNATALTAEALERRGLECAGLVIGAWPQEPDLACRCNVADLPVVAGTPLVGALPAGSGRLSPAEFRAVAIAALAPALDGSWDPEAFARTYAG